MGYGSSIVPRRLNLELSPELQREVDFYCRWGYLVVDEAVDLETIASLRAAVDQLFADRTEPFAHQLLEADERFHPLLDNRPVLDRMTAILGTCIQLHSSTARVTRPGTEEQDWHRDGPWPMDPAGTPYGTLPGQINCGYYLDELTDDNGPIVLVPGSHRAPFGPPEGHVRFPDELRVHAQPGQAVLFDGWLFHRGAANRSSADRRVCLMCYQNAWMKSREPLDGPRVNKLRDEGSPLRQLLLGGVPQW